MLATYAWICRLCNLHRETRDRTPPQCPNCGPAMSRQWNFSFAKPMPDHFNHAVGAYVRNRGELTSEFSRKSDEMSQRMNFDVDLKPIDPWDLKNSPKDFGVGDPEAALAAREKRETDEGKKEVKLWL